MERLPDLDDPASVVAWVTQRLSQVGSDPRAGDGPTRGQRFGRYVILDSAGAGGMGVVYAAYDTVLDRKVALKLLFNATASQASLTEAAAMAQLNHPNVVRVFDAGAIDGVPYLSMELVEGTTLAAWRAQRPRPFRDIARLMAAAARGLAAAHAVGVVHRDVKPQNILVAGDRVLVTDFGVATREAAASGSQAPVGGTLVYMAPEQLRGQAVDARADVYGFSATLYEMLHGQLPHPGRTRDDLLAQTADGPPPRPPVGSRAPDWLHRLALAGLDPDPARRPADLNKVAEQLLADPARLLRNRLLTGAALAAVAIIFWSGRYLAANPERQCRAGGRSIETLYSPALRQQLQARYAQAGKASSWPALERRLDQYTRQWRATHGETCAATFGQGRQSEAMFERRMRCLENRRSGLQVFLTALGSATPTQLVQAAGAVPAPLSDCHSASLADVTPPPADPSSQAQLARTEQALRQALAAQNLGDYPAARDTANQAVEAARKLAHPPLLAAALVRLGEIELRAGSARVDDQNAGMVKAAALLEEGYSAADQGHDDVQRLAAARYQVSVNVALADYTQAQHWMRRARAQLARAGMPPAEATQLDLSLAGYHAARGEDAAVAAPFQQALAHARQIAPPDDRLLAQAEAGVCATTGTVEQKIDCFRRVEPKMVRAFGPEHPELGNFYRGMSNPLEQLDRTRAEACRLRQRALDLWQGHLDPTHPDVIRGTVNLSICLMDNDQIEQARTILKAALARNPRPQQRAHLHEAYGHLLGFRFDDADASAVEFRASVADYETAFGPTHFHPIRIRRNLASMLSRNDRFDDAVRELDAAIEILKTKGNLAGDDGRMLPELYNEQGWALERAEKYALAVPRFEEALRLRRSQKPPPPDHRVAYENHGLGQALLRSGRPREALPHLEIALALRPAGTGINPGLRAFAASGVGEALARTGGDRARACALGQEAMTEMRTQKRPQRRIQTERWMNRFRCPLDPPPTPRRG